MLRVILNADDFGKSPGRNRAIDEALRKGMVTSAGLIVTGKHVLEAADMISEGGYAENVHLHVNLSANRPEEDSDDAPLTEAMKNDPLFCLSGKFILYRGLPRGFMTVFKWRKVYHEIVAQYERFIELTHGKGDSSHIDFHLWYNLTWPASIALNRFTRKYRIKSVRYMGIQHQKKWRVKLYRILSWNPRVKCFAAANIDFFLSKRELFDNCKLVELYCHPNYKNDVFLDDSPSYLKHERKNMDTHIRQVKSMKGLEFISWRDLF